ncbi:hypothetical protein [Rubrivivax gelatinosus]|uniref:Uncharacterized protein n=2 Tax=Rubrivivax gelatinosus TaxID=28068 RepID=I0HQA8_RUBGI|nr:hypothetical protein [Rubrivivax gelatinosus]BAL95195.1 hypothetical protein RGE_18540 [Rubrivivax gelatinosus IL144]
MAATATLDTAFAAPARGRRRRGLALALAAHGLLIAGLLKLAPPPERLATPAAAPVVWLRLLLEPAATPTRDATPSGDARPSARPVPTLQAPAATALPAAEAVAPTPRPAEPAPLQLTLPRGAAARAERSPALDDPRANTQRPTLEARIAKTLEKDWTEELLPDGSRRFRRGNDCILVKDSQATVLDPFNNASRLPPKLAGPC